MKKIGFLMITLLMTVSMAMAQGPRRGERKQMDPKAHAEKRTEHMATEYGLNDTQKAKLLDLNITMAEKMGDRPGPRHHKRNHDGKKGDMKKSDVKKDQREKRDADRTARREVNKEEREKRMAEMKQTRDSYQASLKEIFTADQYKKFEANQTARQEKMKDNNKDRKDKKGIKDRKDKQKA